MTDLQNFFSSLSWENLKNILLFDPKNPLLFNTGLFLVLFVAFLGIYQLLRRYRRLKMIFVILFSLYFYYKSSAECCFILLGVCLGDYLLGRWLYGIKNNMGRRAIVALNVAVNVGMLVYFKYFNLLFESFCSITGRDFDALDIILPAGISFFTFRSISYVVDIYRGKMEPVKSLLDYTFFLTFFPPLLAGPVVRAKDMLPQIRRNPVATRAMVSAGLFLIMSGLVKKVIVSDYIGGNFVDRIFDNPMLYSGFENLMGILGFTIQLYCDFSGYSDMATGLALLLGYNFKINFNAPFKAQNPSEFWRRWHISLSTWLRDYIYIPLGGNRKGRSRTYLNNFLTMLIGGLWHGASWMYIIWGAYHGILLAAHKALKGFWKIPECWKGTPPVRFVNIIITFSLVVIGFSFFRASSLQTIGDIYTQIFTDFHPDIIPQFIQGYIVIVLAMAGGYMLHFSPKSWTGGFTRAYTAMPLMAQAVLLSIIIFLVIQTRQSDLVPFIYLQY